MYEVQSQAIAADRSQVVLVRTMASHMCSHVVAANLTFDKEHLCYQFATAANKQNFLSSYFKTLHEYEAYHQVCLVIYCLHTRP